MPGVGTWFGASAMQSGLELLTRLALVHPKEAKLTVGLDIGSSALKIVILGPRKGSSRVLLGQRTVPLGEAAESQVAAALKETFTALDLPVKTVNLSVSGQWVIMRVVEMPLMTPPELIQALPFEAQRYLPFNIQEVVLDGVALGPTQEGNKTWVLIVACKRELLERRIAWVKQAGVEPAVVDVDALALANAFAEQSDGRQLTGTHGLINVGAQGTNLVVLKDGAPYLVRDIPWGAEKLTRHMAEQLGVEEAVVAAQLKQDVPLPPQYLEAMKVTCEGLATDLQMSFDFFESRFGPPPDQIAVSGGLLQCPGFQEALKSHLAQPLAPWTPTTGLSGQFAIAYGLALRTA